MCSILYIWGNRECISRYVMLYCIVYCIVHDSNRNWDAIRNSFDIFVNVLFYTKTKKTFTVYNLFCVSLFSFFLFSSHFGIKFPHNLCISKWVRTYIYILSINNFSHCFLPALCPTIKHQMRMHKSVFVCVCMRAQTNERTCLLQLRFNCAETLNYPFAINYTIVDRHGLDSANTRFGV